MTESEVWSITGASRGMGTEFAREALAAVPGPPERWMAGDDSVEGVIAKGRLLLQQAEALPQLSRGLGRDDPAY